MPSDKKTAPTSRRMRIVARGEFVLNSSFCIGANSPRGVLLGLQRFRNWRRRSVVPHQRVPADPQQFAKHANAVTQRMNTRSFAMRPCDGDLGDGKTELFSQIEYFRIESPTLDLLQRKDCLRAAPGEGLEAALGVLELQTQDDAQRQVENSSKEPAMQRLPPNLQSRIHPARSDGDIGALPNCNKQLVRLLDRRGKVGIAK